jgi:hypothetical protein
MNLKFIKLGKFEVQNDIICVKINSEQFGDVLARCSSLKLCFFLILGGHNYTAVGREDNCIKSWFYKITQLKAQSKLQHTTNVLIDNVFWIKFCDGNLLWLKFISDTSFTARLH